MTTPASPATSTANTSATSGASSLLRGGEWLLKPSDPASLFTPERITDEQRMIAQTVTDFVDQEVLPALDRLEQKDWALARELVVRASPLGLLGVDVPEAHGGLGLDKRTSMIVSERLSRSASFGATLGAQANLMILPMSLFASDAQKRKYLPKLLSGEIIGAYCLSEPGSGSDALGAKTRAVRQADGSFVLNGEKMWITNGGFADLYIIFCKVIDAGGEHFSAFLVERAFPGVSSGKEEHKMGLHGSSTTPVILQDVKVPAENLMGEVGKGHKIAFNVLNFARFKLGAMCVGGARGAIGEAAKYAGQRKQFGQPIASFGAIKHKIGEMVIRTYAIESLIYRTGGLIDERINATPHDAADQSVALATLEEYAIEASIAKVAGSEMLNFVLDENIQIHGGNGFVRDYPAERHYRDSRVNRIFEGTNEINRLLIPGMLARRALKGEPAIIAAAKALQAELMAPPKEAPVPAGPLGEEQRTVDGFKKAALMIFGMALKTYGDKLSEQQEVLMYISDILMDVFAAESSVLRAEAASRSQANRASLHVDAARVFVNDATERIAVAGRQALAAMVEGDMLTPMLAALRGLLKKAPINTIPLRRRLADETVARGPTFSKDVVRVPRQPLQGTACVVVAAVLLALATGGCSHGEVRNSAIPETLDGYVARISAERTAKDTAFAHDTDQPIPERQRARLLPLAYLPIDPAFRVAATLKPSTDQTMMDMPTSTGQSRKVRRAGTLEFTLKSQSLTLSAFVDSGKDMQIVFIPFSDRTSGAGTYPAGRYLELSRISRDLPSDFNQSANPYCYYNVSYECPLPPQENRLAIAIEAGEKVK